MRGFFVKPSLEGGFELVELSWPRRRLDSPPRPATPRLRPQRRDQLLGFWSGPLGADMGGLNI